jgi:hypothetical protein
LLPITVGTLQDGLGFTARLRNHTSGVGESLVPQSLLVGGRGLHVTERVDDLRWYLVSLSVCPTSMGATGPSS